MTKLGHCKISFEAFKVLYEREIQHQWQHSTPKFLTRMKKEPTDLQWTDFSCISQFSFPWGHSVRQSHGFRSAARKWCSGMIPWPYFLELKSITYHNYRVFPALWRMQRGNRCEGWSCL